VEARPLAADRALPYYLLSGRRLTRDIPAGAQITMADVTLDETAPLLALRRRQDAHFFTTEARAPAQQTV